MTRRWTTSDPRSAGHAGNVGDLVYYASGGGSTVLVKIGPSNTAWAELGEVPRSVPIAASDPRIAGYAAPIDTIVMYATGGEGIYLIKHGNGNTDWVTLPDLVLGGGGSGGVTLPIAESDVTGLVSDLATRPTGVGTTGKSARWTGSSSIGNGAFDDDGTDVTLGGTLTLSPITLGSILFAGTSGLVSQDNSNLFWDDTNNRLGVGTASPATFLDVRGSLATTDAVHIRNSANNGYSAIAFNDGGGTLRGATGYGNSSVADTTVRSCLYWRTLGSNFVFTTGSGTPSSPAMMLFNSTGNVNIGTSTSDPSVKLRVEGALSYTGNGSLGDATTNTHAVSGAVTITGPTSAVGLEVRTTAQANIRIRGDSNNSGSDSAYTGLIIARGGTPTELWYIGRDGTGPSDGLIFRRAGASNDLTIDTSGNATFAGNLAVNGNTTIGNAATDTIAATAHIPSTLRFGSSTGPTVQAGSGSPEGVISAAIGSLFLRTDGGAGTSLYVKESDSGGNTGWAGK